jgi:hypothetical protein
LPGGRTSASCWSTRRLSQLILERLGGVSARTHESGEPFLDNSDIGSSKRSLVGPALRLTDGLVHGVELACEGLRP